MSCETRGRPAIQTVSLSLFRFANPATRLWAFGMMALARRPLKRVEGLEFWKLCGTGPEGSFLLRFNPSVYAILGVWSDEVTARAQLRSAPVFGRYRGQASEHAHFLLSPLSVRGEWAQQKPFSVSAGADQVAVGPIAALTRATLRPKILRRFWGRVPDINALIGSDPNVMFKIGLGEVPALHQVTFSIWPDADSMAKFARRGGPHAEAIRAVRQEGWFSEELYARFRVIDVEGQWTGRTLKSSLVLS